MDIKEKISKIVEELMKNGSLKEQFETEPVKVIEKLLGVDLPDDVVEKIIDGVKAQLTLEKVSDAANVLKGLLK